MADNLLQEVDAALRADRAGALWNQHKKTLITFIVVLILATAANSIWQHYREARGGEMLANLIATQQLLEQGKADEAAQGFKKIADGASGEFKHLALVWESRALFAANKKDEATNALKQAVADGNSLWSDIACLRLAGLDAKAAETCLASKNNSPLASTRAEWSAANLWAKGDADGAIAAIEKMLANKETPAESRQRLTQWLATMKAQKTAPVKNESVKAVEEKPVPVEAVVEEKGSDE